jgi:sugar phosphate isomerase/epimerase
MNLSIASYAFHGLLKRGQMDLFGYLETCKYRYHVNAADIWNGFLPSITDDYLTLVKDGLAEREMALANLCVDGPHIWEDDPAVREQHHQEALAYLHAAETLGAATIRIDAGVRAESFTDEQFDHIVARYREYAQRAYDNGYRVGPENHWGAEAVPENMVRICKAVNHPGFGMLLHFRGTPADATMAPWAMHTHISWDVSVNCVRESMEMLRAAGYRGYYSVEHHSGENEYAEVIAQMGRVAAVLAAWRTA